MSKNNQKCGGGKHCLLVAGATLAILAPSQAAQAVTVVVGTGTVTGYFDNPITIPGSVYTGNGTDTIEWGTPVDGSFTNQLSFIPSDFTDQPKGQDFVAGRLYYRNGTIFGGTGINGVDLIINTTSSDPDFTQTLPLKITIVNTPNVADDPIASADFIYFTDFPDLGSFRVLEGEETYVEVITQFNSLDLVGFGAVGDPLKGFLSPSTGPDPFPAVPEPSSILGLLALGLLGMGSVFNKQRK
ncbi:MAG: PEP-CTERM sorting domain-containing protein [Microcystis aeruginosa L211-101]|nr:PEP-CTERM sorting domain-containing protein [Microcystis aeruginosa L211-11]NCR33796.1 PEP-CTERM sorting domain-containing protein [Microcystis aeruginosa L211-101]